MSSTLIAFGLTLWTLACSRKTDDTAALTVQPVKSASANGVTSAQRPTLAAIEVTPHGWASSEKAAFPQVELSASSDSRNSDPPGAQDSNAKPALSVVTGPELLRRVRSHGGPGVLINVWASWCVPCRAELPFLQRLSGQLAALGVPVWLLSIDDPYALPVTNALLDSMHIDLPRLAAKPPLEELAATLNPNWAPGTIPVSFLFDARGKLARFWIGEVPESELLVAVARLPSAPAATHRNLEPTKH